MTRRIGLRAFVVAGALSLFAAGALADVHFARTDVPTVFFISKSDDRNRVDYGLRLDASCAPRRDRPVFTYWRRFEPNQPPLGELNDLDERAYGIASQRVSSRGGRTLVTLALRSVPRHPILIVAGDIAGRCEARAETTIAGKRARLDHVHVQLGGLLSVDHLDVVGTDLATGASVHERIDP